MTTVSKFNVLSIDPGVRGTGLAVWKMDSFKGVLELPIHVENFMPYSDDDWFKTCWKFHERFIDFLQLWNIKKAYVEWPAYFESAKGHAAATKGDINKLCCLVGLFSGEIWAYGGRIDTVKVNTWKGQLPKDEVQHRIERALPGIEVLKPNSHSWDAVGLGLYAKGFRMDKLRG
jgi:hypothetical protein